MTVLHTYAVHVRAPVVTSGVQVTFHCRPAEVNVPVRASGLASQAGLAASTYVMLLNAQTREVTYPVEVRLVWVAQMYAVQRAPVLYASHVVYQLRPETVW